jgi:hypothetical protein
MSKEYFQSMYFLATQQPLNVPSGKFANYFRSPGLTAIQDLKILRAT